MSTWSIDTKSGIAKARIALGLLQAFALLVINALCTNSGYGSLMFTNAHLNSLALSATFILPTLSNVLLWQAISPERSQPPLSTPHSIRAARWGAIALIPISAICLLLFTFSGIAPQNKVFESSPSFVRNVPVDGPPVRIYRTSGYGSDSVWIQQERMILPGLLWVTQLCREDDAKDVDIQMLDRHHLRCTFPPTEYRQRTDTVVVENP